MAKKKSASRTGSQSRTSSASAGGGHLQLPVAGVMPPTGPANSAGIGVELTGRLIVTLRDPSASGMKAATAMLKDQVGIRASSSRELGDQDAMRAAMSNGGMMLDRIGVMVIEPDSNQMSAMSSVMAADDSLIVEPEYINVALGLELPLLEPHGEARSPTPWDRQYLCGYRAAIDQMLQQMDEAASVPTSTMQAPAALLAGTTWGLRETGVHQSRLTGAGVKIAVLDTGIETRHPDFVGRSIVTRSFVDGETVQDGNGHGTHCCGTACGKRNPQNGVRYGIAGEAELYVGKVLSDGGTGGDGGILAGIDWAIGEGCRIISMSLGAPVFPGQTPPQSYEIAAQRGLQAGCLIFAAAGNESRRPFGIRPVGRPANCPSIAAVGAVDSRLQIAVFSNRAINPGGGEVNLVGPGVDVDSAWRLPQQYRVISGTSMATPHVAGIACYYLQNDPGLDAIGLYRQMVQNCRRLSLPLADQGFGLVQSI